MTVFYEVLLAVLSFVEVMVCYRICGELLGNRIFKNHRVYIGVCIVLVTIATILQKRIIFFSSIFLNFIIIIIWLSIILMTREKVIRCLCIVADYYLLLSLVDYILLFFVTGLIREKYWTTVYVDVGLWRIIICGLSRILILYVLSRIKRYHKKQRIDMSQYQKLLIISGIIGYVWLQWFQRCLIDFGASAALKNGVLLASFLLILIFMCSVYIKSTNIRSQSQMISVKNEMLEKNYQNLEKLYQNNRAIAHDLKNHMLVIETYLNDGEVDKAKQYLEKLTGSVSKVNHVTWSDCEIVNLILNLKCHEAAEKDIHVIADIDNINWERYEEKDLSIILFNLLDNALEACSLMTSEERWISITVKRKNEMSVIKIENSIQKGSVSARKTYTTTKEEKDIHGYGIKSVKSVVESYGGEALWHNTEDSFTAVITFFENEMI